MAPAHADRPAGAEVSISHAAGRPHPRPLAYGYVRVSRDEDAGDHDVRTSELRIRNYAATHEFILLKICHDVHSGVGRMWAEFVAELERAGAHYVIVPSLGHLSSHPLLQLMMRDRLVRVTHVDVLELGDRP